jgi:hypothetical protein
MFEKLASLNERHHEVDSLVTGEHSVHRNDEGVADLKQDELFHLQGLQGVILQYNVFSNALHGMKMTSCLVFNEIDLSEGAASDQTDDMKVI